MRAVRFAIFLLAILFTTPDVASAQELAAEQLVERYGKSVVSITATAADGSVWEGSGFVISSSGRIATHYEVVRKALKVEIRFTDGKVFTNPDFVTRVPYVDVAVFDLKTSLQPIPLGDASTLKPGARIYVIGNAAARSNTITDGIFNGLDAEAFNDHLLQISAPVSDASIGGPVLNKEGKVIGVAVRIAGCPVQNVAVSINELFSRLKDHDEGGGTDRHPLRKSFFAFSKDCAVDVLGRDDHDLAIAHYAALARSAPNEEEKRNCAFMAIAISSAKIAALGDLCSIYLSGIQQAESLIQDPMVISKDEATAEKDWLLQKWSDTAREGRSATRVFLAVWDEFKSLLGKHQMTLDFDPPYSWSGEVLACDLLKIEDYSARIDSVILTPSKYENELYKVHQFKIKHRLLKSLADMLPAYPLMYRWLEFDAIQVTPDNYVMHFFLNALIGHTCFRNLDRDASDDAVAEALLSAAKELRAIIDEQ